MYIPYNVRYKRYPYAPKASAASMRLGYLFAWPTLLAMAFVWAAVVAWLLDRALSAMPYESCMVIALATLVPAGAGLFKWRKAKNARIDERAREEAAAMLAMTPEERKEYEQELTRKSLKTGYLIGAGCVLFILLLLLLAHYAS